MGDSPKQPVGGPGDLALKPWFPRPDPGALVAVDVGVEVGFMEPLLTDVDADEWRHKVGVAGGADGSAKASTRLVASRGWVFKTNLDQRRSTSAHVVDEMRRARDDGLRAGLWHPSKRWAAFRSGEGWYPLTACRELATLRRDVDFATRSAGWIAMIEQGLRVSREFAIGLDLNPANFGRDDHGALHYLDDETYGPLTERVIAAAAVARIPEEPAAAPEIWAAWGRRLAQALRRYLSAPSWAAVVDELGHYPLTERFAPQRCALLQAVRGSTRATRGASNPRPIESSRLACVLADVHANCAALDAVLSAAQALGADGHLFLGDSVGYGPDPSACVQRLAELPCVAAVRGNHDHAIATSRYEVGMNALARQCADWTRRALDSPHIDWLLGLPREHVGQGWMAVHGAPKDANRFLAYVYELTYEDNLRHLIEKRQPPICFFGHTHVQMAYVESAAGPLKIAPQRSVELSSLRAALVNPGSVGQPRDGLATAAFALWDRTLNRVSFHRVAYDVEQTATRMVRAGLPEPLIARLRQGA